MFRYVQCLMSTSQDRPPSCRWNAQHAQGWTPLPGPHELSPLQVFLSTPRSFPTRHSHKYRIEIETCSPAANPRISRALLWSQGNLEGDAPHCKGQNGLGMIGFESFSHATMSQSDSLSTSHAVKLQSRCWLPLLMQTSAPPSSPDKWAHPGSDWSNIETLHLDASGTAWTWMIRICMRKDDWGVEKVEKCGKISQV